MAEVRSITRRAWLAGAFGLALASRGSGVARAQATLPELLASFRRVPGLRARFHEVKRVRLLRNPIESDGTLHFAPPRRLARHVTGARWSSIVVDGSRITIATASETREVPVSASGAARPFLEGFTALLAGDLASLERSFATTYVPGESWQLTLAPRTSGPIVRVVVRGRGVVLSDYRIDEASGDVTEVRLSDVDVSHAYSDREARRVFRAASR